MSTPEVISNEASDYISAGLDANIVGVAERMLIF
jgi:hypothetical protein